MYQHARGTSWSTAVRTELGGDPTTAAGSTGTAAQYATPQHDAALREAECAKIEGAAKAAATTADHGASPNADAHCQTNQQAGGVYSFFMGDHQPTHADVPDPSGIPKPVPPGRARLVTAGIVVMLAAIATVPALLAAPLANPVPVFMTAGVLAGAGCFALPHLRVARDPWQRHGPALRFLSARTWTGPRTIDLHDIRSVRTWKEVYRGGAATYLVVTDTSGTRLGLTGPQADRLIRRYAVERPQDSPGSRPIRVTRLAQADLGIKPLPRGVSALRSLLALERSVLLVVGPMMLSAVIASH